MHRIEIVREARSRLVTYASVRSENNFIEMKFTPESRDQIAACVAAAVEIAKYIISRYK